MLNGLYINSACWRHIPTDHIKGWSLSGFLSVDCDYADRSGPRQLQGITHNASFVLKVYKPLKLSVIAGSRNRANRTRQIVRQRPLAVGRMYILLFAKRLVGLYDDQSYCKATSSEYWFRRYSTVWESFVFSELTILLDFKLADNIPDANDESYRRVERGSKIVLATQSEPSLVLQVCIECNAFQ